MQPPELIWALVAILGVQAITIAAVLGLGRREAQLSRWLPFLVSGAAGVLLSTACLDLLPEATRDSTLHSGVWTSLLLTILVLFFLQACAHAFAERSLAPDERASQEQRSGPSATGHTHSHGSSSVTSPVPLLLGSALHSATDGLAIAAAFAAGRRPGWIAAFAIGLHELPHRTGDFALLLHMGVSKRRAAQMAIGAGIAALLGWLAVALLDGHPTDLSSLLPVSAGTFLYVALVDLLPGLNSRRRGSDVWWQMICLGVGAGLIALLTRLPGE